ncbi:MAG: PIN domain-containing protein [Candidatus Altiarchaeota archaeon]
MKLVVDANIIFSALIKDSVAAELLLHQKFSLYAPEYLLAELAKHREEVLAKTSRNPDEFDQLIDLLSRRINFTSRQEIQPYMAEAAEFTPDPGDTPYLALALKLKAPIWTNDKQLQKQKTVKIYTTQQIFKTKYENKPS